ncbi:MAG: DUF4998 domain-containing protein [Bacteroidota bacterium]
MKNSILIIILIAFVLWFFSGCSDMNDKHDLYLAEGEQIYIGKVDSLKVFPGDNRVKLRFWASDPRCSSVGFYWTPYSDSLIVDINKNSPIDSFEVFIGGENSAKTISEGSYNMKVVTFDEAGNFSIPFEKTIDVYGEQYRSTLGNKVLSSLEYQDSTGTLSLFFADPLREDDIGIAISYTNREGEAKNLVLPNSEITSPVNISNVDVSEGVSYQTLYLPEPNAIDTFTTNSSDIEISQVINVALNKPVKVSDILNDNFIGPNAVDGIIDDNASRWVSSSSGEHWIEIDLEQEYSIHKFKTWVGAKGFNNPVANFIFQAEIDGEWHNILEVSNNSDPQFEASFPEVTTKKVRYFVPEYENNMVRLYEIAVYAKITY